MRILVLAVALATVLGCMAGEAPPEAPPAGQAPPPREGKPQGGGRAASGFDPASLSGSWVQLTARDGYYVWVEPCTGDGPSWEIRTGAKGVELNECGGFDCVSMVIESADRNGDEVAVVARGDQGQKAFTLHLQPDGVLFAITPAGKQRIMLGDSRTTKKIKERC